MKGSASLDFLFLFWASAVFTPTTIIQHRHKASLITLDMYNTMNFPFLKNKNLIFI